RRSLIETHPRRTLLHSLGVRERGQRVRDAIEQRQARVILHTLQLLPVDDNSGRSIDLDVAENMRVTVNHLGAHDISDVADVEPVGIFLCNGAVHEHLEQQVSELLAQCRPILAIDGLEDLVRLLEEIRTQSEMRLLSVPRAATGRAQTLDDLVQGTQRIDRLVTHVATRSSDARAVRVVVREGRYRCARHGVGTPSASSPRGSETVSLRVSPLAVTT